MENLKTVLAEIAAPAFCTYRYLGGRLHPKTNRYPEEEKRKRKCDIKCVNYSCTSKCCKEENIPETFPDIAASV